MRRTAEHPALRSGSRGRPELRVNFIYERAPHHSVHSGYDQLIAHLGPGVGASRLRDPFPRRLVWRLAAKFSARSRMMWYWSGSFFPELWAMVRILARSRQIYHFLYGEDGYRYSGCLAGLRRNRIICTFHQPPTVFDRVVQAKHHLKKLTAIVAVASNQVPYFGSLVGEQKVSLIPHGVDTAFFRPSRMRSDTHTCLFVGQWLRDFSVLREVVTLVRAKRKSIRFEIVARPEYTEEFTRLEGVTVRSAIGAESLLALYQASALLVLPLVDSTANNAILEAMACGLPILTTDVGGIRDYVDPECARLVPPRDPQAMAEGALELLDDATGRAAMARAGRIRAEAFAWSRIVEQLLAFYEALA